MLPEFIKSKFWLWKFTYNNQEHMQLKKKITKAPVSNMSNTLSHDSIFSRETVKMKWNLRKQYLEPKMYKCQGFDSCAQVEN